MKVTRIYTGYIGKNEDIEVVAHSVLLKAQEWVATNSHPHANINKKVKVEIIVREINESNK